MLRPSSLLFQAACFISKDARFVEKIRLLDYWGIQDSALSSEFRRSMFLLMVDGKPMVKKDGRTINLAFCNYPGRFCEESSAWKIASELRMTLLGIEDEKQRNLLAKFQSLSRWSHIYRRCPRCGSVLRMRVSKSAAKCVACSRIYYPTLHPVTLTLVSNSADSHALLIRHKGSAGGVYTTISGYANAGESLEDCVRREVAEEVGILVSDVVSLSHSQPWPMPDSSLMCAHYAIADMTAKITVCPGELEAARWCSREEVAHALQRTLSDPFLKGLSKDIDDSQELMYIPPQGAIAHHIIKLWVNRDLFSNFRGKA
ncbi:hydrolase, NUDIX family [Dictyocaulus viviparus]|uniref:NAD(+) diphosphatase n=1 Tax=Dictyocaulus viviparus TaxID=29172 RepID=A0A0D8Y919_DICVI|nr:hydrolase, NUDIX family [Dictyocaulus viviparus]